MKNIDSDLIRGNIDTIILTTMLDGDKYGLDIIKEVEIRSNGTYELKQPTLYSCLKRLENQELISSYWLDSDIGGRRHYYKLTEKGKESLLQKQEEWAKSKFIIDNLLSNHNYDEYRLVKKEDYDKIIEGKQFEYNKEESPAFVQDDKIVEDSLNQSDSSIEEESLEEYPEDAEEDSLENFDQIDAYNNNALIEEDSIEENFDQEESNETIDEPAFDFSKRIDYNDENDDVENDYPNQKRFKIPSIYDSINIDEDELNSYKTDNEENIQDIDEESNIEYEDTSLEDDDFISEYESYIDDENTEEDEDIQYNSLLNDEYNLGEDSIEEDDDRVYISNYNEDEEDDEDLDIPTNTRTDQAQNELNILSRLRMQDDEEINE